MNIKKFLLTLFVLCSSCAASAETETAMTIETDDGQTVNYLFSQQPVVTFSTDDLNVKVEGKDLVQYPLAHFVKFYFTEVDTKDAIHSLKQQSVTFRITDGALQVYGLQAGENVSLYTIGGVKRASIQADAQGQASLSLEGQPAQVYVVRAGKTGYKFIKH